MKPFIKISLYIMVWIALTSFSTSAGMYSGLWVGDIEVTKINEAASKVDTSTVKDVKNTFDLRILLHSDKDGKVKLLRDVTVMQKRYTVQENNTTTEMVRRVLITDDTLLPQYDGVVRRDGKLTGMRIGTAAFDFDPSLNELDLTGTVEPLKSVSGTIILSKTHPSNPFRHIFHPDHQNDGDKGVEIRRDIKLTFDPIPANPKPEDGVSTLKGVYQETITGLHKTPLKLEGKFRLDRLSTIDKLNDK